MGFMPFNPSSIVKTAPHFGHFTCWSVLTIPAQPKENAARTNNAATMLIHFFTPLHLLSFGRCLPQLHKTIEETFLLHKATTGDLRNSPLFIIKANKSRFFSQGKNLGDFYVPFCRMMPRVKFPAKRLPVLAFHVIRK
jgi:hypothetical protein